MNTPQSSARQVLDYLTGPAAGQVVTLAFPAGVDNWQVLGTHVRPGGAVSVTYRVRQVLPGSGATNAAPAAATLETTLVVSTEKIPRGRAQAFRFTLPSTVANAPATPVHAYWWIYPNDPQLPGLPAVADVQNLRHVLAHSEHPKAREIATQLTQTRAVVYRPTRRAVVCGQGTQGPLAWVKVASPQRVKQLARTLGVLAESAVPVPRVLAYPSADTIVQEHGHGFPLSRLISSKPHVAANMFHQIRDLLDALPAGVNALPERDSWTQRRAHYGQAMVALLPDLEPQVRALLSVIEARLVANQPRVPVHGDLFEANLLTDGAAITTLLDLDTMGPGLRADDYACLLAHVSVLPFLTPSRWVDAAVTEPWRSRLNQFLPHRRCPDYSESETVLEAWRLRAERECIPADLYARCAAVTLSLASSTSLKYGEEEARARFRRAQWWAQLATEYA